MRDDCEGAGNSIWRDPLLLGGCRVRVTLHLLMMLNSEDKDVHGSVDVGILDHPRILNLCSLVGTNSAMKSELTVVQTKAEIGWTQMGAVWADDSFIEQIVGFNEVPCKGTSLGSAKGCWLDLELW